MDSGGTEEDAILNCCKHHWVYKKNKNIKTHNNNVTRSNKPEERRQLAPLNAAPDNLNQPAELFPPEAISFLIFLEHPIFLQDSYSTTVNTNHAPVTSPEETSSDTGTTSPVPIRDAEDGTFRNRMTAKGILKSQNTLRVEDKQERKKKQRKVNSKQHGDIIDLTSASVQNDTRRTEASTQHAEAASKQADDATMQAITGMYQSQLEALQKAQNMCVTAEELRPFILKTLTYLYNSSDATLKQLVINMWRWMEMQRSLS
jgi:hypothetical protein